MSNDVLEEVDSITIDHYVMVRRHTIANFIVNRPIFELCQDEVRPMRGTSTQQYWWEQPIDLDAVRASYVVTADDDEEDDIITWDGNRRQIYLCVVVF